MRLGGMRIGCETRRQAEGSALARQAAVDKSSQVMRMSPPELWRAALTAPTDGANLSGIEDRGVKRKLILSFHPFSVSRTDVNKRS